MKSSRHNVVLGQGATGAVVVTIGAPATVKLNEDVGGGERQIEFEIATFNRYNPF